jgi:hypothetical protein
MKRPNLQSVVVTGAYGGVPSRRFPTDVQQTFFPLVGSGMPGIGNRIAFRPPGAPMLQTSDFHSNANVSGMTKGMATAGFERGKSSINSAAIDRATHITDLAHATLRRKVLRGTT